jgi:hypothetical protein
VDVQWPKVLAQCFLLFDADVLEVLTSEDYDASLGDK